MLTIQNFKRIEGQTFWTKSNTQEWNISTIVENTNEYQIVVLPKDKDTNVFSISGSIVYRLHRTSNTPDGYELSNTRNKRRAWVRMDNLEFGNFLLELMIQTSLNTN